MSRTILMAGGGTGGHVFPMVAVAEQLQRLAPEVRLVFIGTERGLEAKVVPERGWELELVNILPLRGGGVRGALRGAFRAAASIPESFALVRRYAPSALLSIGGYAAGPVSLAARLSGVPVALMEPNGAVGLSNRLIAPVVHRAYTAFAEAERVFRAPVVRRFGVPIREGFDPQSPEPVGAELRILVLGGSQGAKSLNEAVPEALGMLDAPVRVTHQCGPKHADDVRARYQSSPLGERASVVPFIDDMPAAIAAADLVVARSGASCVSEVCAIGRPSILVPYPYAADDHQMKNARSLEADGAAVCIANSEATPERVAEEIARLAGDRERLARMASAARERGKPGAARDIARDLLALAGLEPSVGAERAAAARDDSDPGHVSLTSSAAEAC